ncbi:universal stress protein [Ralstonia solanacearum]|uniref:Universal stress protein UspA n=1 Tax=Ralstonia solanacearum K60 TaxID=1091042 RepID=A0AAP7ZQ51_RALSL|nr:universal stress protein [Ralstonia solanacearum]MBT1538374.1 universal stress protein [Ralstonia solanacearum]OKA43165.1 universal stress protein UspA [Ralstonia solanacearum]OYQ14725.1 universal stress protein UspA [Ralstonia solanacearum K60]QOK82098.1 universal stress protein [Ralstonia solanacearum]RIJ85476.1 universal stress protein [Ralstonia solanacearum]
MYQRILLAIDGSHASQLALEQTAMIGQATGAEVEALFVADDTDAFFDPVGYDAAALAERILEYGRETLAQAAARLQAAGVHHTTKLLEKPVSPGKISATIVAEADTSGADLIVLGTHGRRGLKHMVMGSVAEGVVHKTNKPVLMVRSEAET